MAPRPGFEPGTCPLGGGRAIQLCHRGKRTPFWHSILSPPDQSNNVMKAVVCERLDGFESLVYRDIDEPGDPNETQIKVAIKARGVSFTDILTTKGEYQTKTDLPFPVGGEGAGLVTTIGSQVKNFKPGDRVLVPGGCVEQVLVDSQQATLLPSNVDLDSAASFRSNYLTALVALQRAQLEAGETLLVHGAAGGVGLAAVDLGKLMGARVIATASSDEKLKVVDSLGANHLLNYSKGGFREKVKDLTNGQGADVIYDPVGGEVFEESMRCIAPFGRILIVGFTSGKPALAKTNHLLVKDAQIIGFTIGGFKKHAPEKAKRNESTLMDWLGSKRIHPYISHRFPLKETVDALRLITQRKVIGKVLITND